MENKVQVFINVTSEGYIKDVLSGRNVVADADYDYFFYMTEQEAQELGRAKVVIDENMKPQLVKESAA
jgi:hypothetical protein